MVGVLAGVLIAAAIIVLWLMGKLIGRIAMFLALASIALIMSLIANIPGYSTAYLVLGLPLAWVIASAPMWIARHRIADASFVVPYPR